MRLRDDGGGDVHREQLSQHPSQHVPVQVVAHDCPPEGPNRSVLMARGSWPASMSRSASASTNPVGPHTNTAGAWLAGNPAAAMTLPLIRPVGSPDPAGAARV